MRLQRWSSLCVLIVVLLFLSTAGWSLISEKRALELAHAYLQDTATQIYQGVH